MADQPTPPDADDGDIMTDDPTAYIELLDISDDDQGRTVVRWKCSICGRYLVDDDACPDHAPLTAPPGWRLTDCTASPPHYILVHNREDYGVPCFVCLLNEQAERDEQARQCRHWPWRRWKLTHWISGQLYTLGVTSGGGGAQWGDGHDRCLSSLPNLRGRRVYILGVRRETWRCWLVGHHRRGEEVGFGFCGKCVPWPCCGSEREAHAAGCPEAAY